jgi:hypothetical protein
MQTSSITSDVTNDAAAKVMQEAEATSSQLLLTLASVTEAEAENKISNIIKNNLKYDLISNCNAAMTQDQTVIDQGGWIVGSDVSQVADLYFECVQDAVANSQIDNKILADVDQKVKAETEGLFSGIAKIIMYGIIAIVLIIILVIVIAMVRRRSRRMRREEHRQDQERQMMMMSQMAPPPPPPPASQLPSPPPFAPQSPEGMTGFVYDAGSNKFYSSITGDMYDPDYQVVTIRNTGQIMPVSEYISRRQY